MSQIHDSYGDDRHGDGAPQGNPNARYQPASSQDLERFPPRDALCAEMRGMLRDYSDRDLEAVESRRVDEHLHGCRDCGLALSRVELETLRLTRGFADEASAARKFAGQLSSMSSRVRDRVIAAEDVVEPSADFTKSVMARVHREWRRPESSARRENVQRFSVSRGVMAASAIAAALVIGVVVWAFVGEAPNQACTSIARVVSVHGSVGLRTLDPQSGVFGPSEAVVAGMVIDAATNVLAQRDSSLRLEIRRDQVVGDSVADIRIAEIELEDRAELSIGADATDLTWTSGTGRIRVDTAGSLQLAGLADGWATLGGGIYDLRVAQRQRFDDSRVASVRLEVLAGRAVITRGDESVDVQDGRVAHFGHFQPLSVEDGMSQELLEFAAKRGAAVANIGEPDDEPQWVGRVVDDLTGVGVAGAAVALDLNGRRVERTTDERGEFELPSSASKLCVVSVLPPAGSELHGVAPRPVALPAPSGGSMETLRLAAGSVRTGIVTDHAGQALADARIVPCVVDEMFGRCDVREDLAVQTDADGRFRLSRLPNGLAHAQAIALIVEHATAPTTVFRSDSTTFDPSFNQAFDNLRVDAPRDLQLEGLPPSQQVSLLQEVPGLSVRSFALRSELESDADGRAIFSGVGRGRVYLVDQDDPRRAVLMAARSAAGAVSGPEVLSVTDSSVSATVAAAAENSTDTWAVRSGNRFAVLRTVAPSDGASTGLFVVDADSNVKFGTRLFLVTAGGSVEFLGEFSGEPVQFSTPADVGGGDYTIVAIGPDGSVGWRSGMEFEGRPAEAIQMDAPGAVQFDPAYLEDLALNGSVDATGQRSAVLLFRLKDGPLAGTEFSRVVRVEDQPRVEGLVPGEYVIEFENGGQIEARVAPGGSVSVGEVLRGAQDDR